MNQRNMVLFQKKLKMIFRQIKLFGKSTSVLLQRKLHKIMPAKFGRYNKRLVIGSLSVICLAVVISMTMLLNTIINKSLTAYEVSMNGRIVGVVRSEKDYQKAVELAREEIEELFQQEVVFDEEVKFIEVKAASDLLTDKEQIIRNLKQFVDIKVKSVGIKVNGEVIAFVKDMKSAEAILEEIKQPYIIASEENNLTVSFAERVELEEIPTHLADIKDEEEVISFILKGTDEAKEHVVASGDNSWTIAKKYELTVDDIKKANPDINPEKLKIGQKISLVVPKPYINVRTKQYAELVEVVPFDTKTETTDTLYKGDRKIVVQGVEGSKEVKAYIIKENGIEVGREIVEEKLLLEPKTKVVAEGTKARPATMATGLFSNPTRGRLTSVFGTRWGAKHTGIDVAASTGTTVAAADGGKVTFASSNGSYGNLIIIDHENGYQTYYAHLNKFSVKKGDRVYKGQKIGEMGNTGRSTGPHLHFEVRKSGTPINPLGFVKY